ncbi:ubiquinone/menaquinone biosynthesis C-methylase UbiE [Stackebrandtia albiflava]|uniref:Ubiquinone/menaquinone biosynthesis C-methylase UbiE n=1 Tax=Stackebrandtia albiflava TaxID=406432 RepID=A0A562V9B2_9ACTN|nr:methyltransferase domain-containing protein [Stackebrandtia albiflava]TWJ14489.1 ubiquinone/menaquinone biosynthesis C-methylase UbiE [Stackebrandtia albiflava]
MQTNDAQLLVLSALAGGPLHGYAINAAIARLSGHRLGPGSLYGAMNRLRAKGLIEPAEPHGRRNPVRLTTAGQAELRRGVAAMSQVFEAVTPDRVDYLDRAARSSAGHSYKPLLRDALDIRGGHTVLDLGCGPGTDLAAMAVPGARVIGLDNDPVMTATATERTRPPVEVVRGDVHDLPFGDATIDRVRTDRVLQHVADPARVLAEARRVLRPGGRLVMAEPDWHTLAVDHPVATISAAYTRFITERVVRNAGIGRALARLAADAGFTVPHVVPVTPVFREVVEADRIFGFQRNTARAVAAGHLTPEQAERWLRHLSEEPFLATVTQFVVTADRT